MGYREDKKCSFESENGRKAKVAFKPDIDDLRESPALYIARRLEILAVEPNIEYKEAIKEADIVTFLVAHKEFKKLDIKTDLNFCGVNR